MRETLFRQMLICGVCRKTYNPGRHKLLRLDITSAKEAGMDRKTSNKLAAETSVSVIWTGMRRGSSVLLAALAMMLLAAGGDSDSESAAVEASAGLAPRSARLIPVPLPIVGNVDTNVKRMIDQVVSQQEDGSSARPVLILEFRAKRNQSGEGSEFERSLSLARYLASDRLTGVHTVAYLPSSVKGHACLVVMACEEMIIAADAEFGEAGAGEDYIDATMRSSYEEIATRRRTVRPAVALGMLDRNVAVHKAETLEGIKYVLDDELTQLQDSGSVTSVESIVAPGDLASFTGRELRLEHGFASHLASDRNELLSALELPPGALEQDPSLGGGWRPIRVDVRGHITSKNINWLTTSIKERLSGAPDKATNFICLVIDSPGGSLTDSLRFADFLAGLDSTQVRTVAFVQSEARGDAAVIAWACDQLVIGEDAILGGAGASNLSEREAPELQQALRAIAQEKQRDWSLAVAMVDPKFQVYECSASEDSQKRYFSEEERDEQNDPARWERGDLINLKDGLSGTDAHEMHLAKYIAGSLAEVQQLYHIDEELPGIEPNWAHLAIERLASPQLAGTLLFIAWFALIIEISQPGVSVAGFVSALCFLLFFWSNILHGTAVWLEVLLFAAGVGSLIVEIFVLPGFGVFGFGGACMVIASLVLASQTFIFPQNSYQFGQFANSMMMVTVGMAGAFISLVGVRKYLPEVPVFKRLVLATDEDDLAERADRELLADYRHLMGKRGTTTTQLTPSGKARFGDDVIDVISDGEAVPQNTDVFVAEVRGNRVLVEIVTTAQIGDVGLQGKV
ncbi:MAG: hypothetical protein CMJ64_13885 [Planctomycetaceae bacterium]|nr:hypothetical protein [Planctomycetaceae bacterium]